MYLPTIIHEIIGIVLLILVVIHLLLNKSYLKNITKGKYNFKRILVLIINVLFMLTFFVSMICGILSSQDLLKFISVDNLIIIKLHKILSYFCLVFMGLHLGINFNSMFGKLFIKIKNKIIIYISYLIVIIFGIYSWINLEFWNHLIGRYGFGVVSGNIFINILEFISVVLMITILTNIIYKRIGDNKNER